MGQEISSVQSQDLDNMKKYTGFSPKQVEMIKERFDLICDEDQTVDKETFAKILKISPKDADIVFDFFDNDKSGRVDSYEFICGLTLLSRSTLLEKADIIFNLYDFDRSQLISKDELIVLMKTVLTSLNYMAGKAGPSMKEVETRANEILRRWDTNKDGSISKDEFYSFVTKDPDILKVMLNYGLVNKEELRQDFGGAGADVPECDSDLEDEINLRDPDDSGRTERIKAGIEFNIKKTNPGEPFEVVDEGQGDQFMAVKPWIGTVKASTPSDYKAKPSDKDAPEATLELKYVHGYRCHDTRNNLRYSPDGLQAIYHTAAVGVVLDIKNNTQKFCIEHTDDITCLDTNGELVVTGQVGNNPLVVVWNCVTMETKLILQGDLQKGISQVCFSNSGKKLVAVSNDEDHTIGIYDLEKLLNPGYDKRKAKIDGAIIIGKGPRAGVLDAKFDPTDNTIILTCVKEVNNVTIENGVVKVNKSFQWGNKIQPQAVMCVSFIDQSYVAGTFSGNLIQWKAKTNPTLIPAHTGNVTAICARKKGKGIITGGNDGIINIWDATLKDITSFDLKALNINSLNPKVRSLCENAKGNILIGTRGGEIVELVNNKATVLMRGHFDDELWGLAVHPSKNEYVTVGEDQLLACWDVNTCKQKMATKLEYKAKVLAFSKDEKFLAVGCVNGFVLILNPTNFNVIQTLKDRPKEISEIKFSPNNEFLAVGAHDSQIFVYSVKKNFKIQSKVHSHHSAITHFDFNNNSTILQSNCTSYELLYSDPNTGKKNPQGAAQNKDEKWATWTCTIGWPVQGIWPECSDGSDINAVDRHPTDNVLATGDDFSKIKLFKYPCPQEKSSFIKFVGHSSHVTNVRFTSNGAWLISTGGHDKSIFQWRYNFDQEVDEQLRTANENPAEVEGEKKAVNMFEEEKIEGGDEALAVKPFLGEVKHSVPTGYKAPKDAAKAPDGNLKIKYCHGYRCFDAKNTAKYVGNSDKIVFVGAALGVTMDIRTKEQSFFQMHEEDIICLAVHPNGKYAATGQMAQKGKAKAIDMFVWDMENKTMLSRMNNFHLRAVSHVAFSPKGDKLLSIGRDDDNSLAIYDWQQGLLLGTAKVDKSKVTGIAYKPDSDSNFMTVGVKHIKFWTVNGKNITPQRGTLDATQQNEPILSCAYLGNNAIVGTQAGNLIPFSGNAGGKSVKAHQGGVWSLCPMNKNNLLSGGADGKVIIWAWSNGLNRVSEYWNVASISKFSPGVTSLDVRADGNTVLVGTVASEIYEVAKSGKETLLLQGHYDGELWGCSVSPNEMKYVTCGGDKTIRLWDASKLTMITATKVLENDVRAIDWAPNGKFIVAADVKGKIMLLNSKDLNILDQMQSSFTKANQWLEDIKVSPDSQLIAFGAHGGASPIELMSVKDDSKLGKMGNINCGLTSALLHLDWSSDSQVLVCNSQAYELKFVNVVAKKNIAASASKDIEWATWTCKLGFPVQGIFQSVDYTDVNSVCRAGNKKILATGDDNGKVNLFKYPCTVEKSQCKAYIGHSSHVTRVKFTFNDSRVISTGGNDKCVLVWDTDFGKEDPNKASVVQEANDDDDFEDDNNDYVEKKVVKDKYGRKPNAVVSEEKSAEPAGLFAVEELGGGDEFMAVKPWLGAIKEPTGWKKAPLNQNQPPKINLTLDYVHGYRAKDCRNNLRYLKNGQIVYHAAAVGIVLDPVSNTQRFFTEHIDDITAMDVHPNGILVATGELGPKPSIYVWDTNTMQKIHQFKGGLQKGIASLSFSLSGKFLAGVAIDNDHYVGVYDTEVGSMICMDKGDTARIVDLKFKSDNEFVSVGPKHFKQWTFQNKTMTSKKGQFGSNNNILRCVTFNDGVALAGAADGNLQTWNGNSIGKCYEVHKGTGVDSIWVGPYYVVTGGGDGTVCVLDKKTYAEIARIDLATHFKNSFSTKVRSACLSADSKTLLVGTYGSEIYELPVKELKANASKYGAAKELVKGHYTPNQKWTNEVWGLANFNKDLDKYATCSDDATLRIWSSKDKKQLKATLLDKDKDGKEIPKNGETGDLEDSTKGRSLDVSPDDKLIAVGCKDGTLRIFETETLKQIHVMKLAKEWVQELKFSPDGSQLAVGSHDNAIYTFSVPENFKKKFTMKKHSSFITHLDWSEDGTKLHSNCGAYELLFWDAQSGKQITSGATQTKDEKWQTWTCVLGWPVQGIWPAASDGSDINYVSRSATKTEGGYELLASADDFGKVKVFRYPCIAKGSLAVEGKGHSSHVTCVKFNGKDDMLFSTGGEDNCVFQWKVEPAA